MALSRARVMRGEMPDDVDLEMLSYLPAWMYTFAGIPNSRNRHSIYSRLLIAPPRSGLRSAIRAGGHGTTLKKLLRRARDRIQPSNSTYFQGARLTTRVSSRRPSWTGSHARMSAAEPCKVCKAKRAGTAPPKRKCTCDSGTTVQRNRVSASAAVPARAEREPPMWQAIPGLFDEFDVRVESSSVDASGHSCVVFPPNPAAQDFHDFQHALDYAVQTDDVDELQAVMERSDLASLEARHAYSMEELRRNALGWACMTGSKELLEYWLDRQKLLVSDQCPYYYEKDEVAATPLHIAAANGHAAIVQELLLRGADPDSPASDGTTPFFRACEEVSRSHMSLLATRVSISNSDCAGTS